MTLRLRELELDPAPWRPLVMGVVNASHDSFSETGPRRGLDALVRHANDLAAAGADLIDVGGESGRTDRAAVSAEEEAERVVPLVERLAGEGLAVSIDTWKAPVARAALAAGAVLVNDVSGLRDPDIATACAEHGAGLVVTHTLARPKVKEFPSYGDLLAEVVSFLRERMEAALELGVEAERVIVDPGPDLSKTPAQTVEVLRALPALRALGRPILLAVSRKDFVGTITGRRPAERLGGTLAAVGAGLDGGASILRVHDVRAVRDYLAVRAVMRGDEPIEPDATLPEHLRREGAA